MSTSAAEMRAHKASRGKSYRAQVIETLWMMVFFSLAFGSGWLAAVRYR